MKEKELRAAADCGLCHEKIGKSRLPLFYRVRVERWGIKADAVQRKTGLEMMLGSPALASVMGPDEDMAVEVMEPVTLTVCESCAYEQEIIRCALDASEKRDESVEP